MQTGVAEAVVAPISIRKSATSNAPTSEVRAVPASPALERELRDTNVVGSIIWTLLAIGMEVRRRYEAIGDGQTAGRRDGSLQALAQISRQPPLAAPNSCSCDATRA